ncbi:microsomal glutathione S-transferase 1-like isoform X1 [Festucalex cinctus]
MTDLMRDEVFVAFSTYSLIVITKLMIMAPITAHYRFSRGAFANEEDVGHKPTEERKKMLRTHPDVERVRRRPPPQWAKERLSRHISPSGLLRWRSKVAGTRLTRS